MSTPLPLCSLIRATIYPQLRDHPSVAKFPPVRGLNEPLFFVDHSHPEGGGTDEGKSKFSAWEVDFSVALARSEGGAARRGGRSWHASRRAACLRQPKARGPRQAACGAPPLPCRAPMPPSALHPCHPLCSVQSQVPGPAGLHGAGRRRDHHALRGPAAALEEVRRMCQALLWKWLAAVEFEMY